MLFLFFLALTFLVESTPAEQPVHAVTDPYQNAILVNATDAECTPRAGRTFNIDHDLLRMDISKRDTRFMRVKCDRNGIPLTRGDYVSAAYMKFPPEGECG